MIEIVLIIIGILVAIIVMAISKNKEREIKQIRSKYNIVEGKIKYSDLYKPAEVLFSEKLRLVGKPDYIVKINNAFIPVEVKKGNHLPPFQSHIIQLIAYCYLVEEKYKTKVPYGILAYENYQIKIPYSEDKKEELLEVIKIMKTQKNFKRNHEQINKCLACGFNYACKNKL